MKENSRGFALIVPLIVVLLIIGIVVYIAFERYKSVKLNTQAENTYVEKSSHDLRKSKSPSITPYTQEYKI